MKSHTAIARLNPPGQTFNMRLEGGGRDTLSAEDIAFAMASVKDPIGSGIIRVKWALQVDSVAPLIASLSEFAHWLAEREGWWIKKGGILERLSVLALRKTEIIKPEWRGLRIWTPQDAVNYCPKPEAVRTEKQRRRWAMIANKLLQAGELDGRCLLLANRDLMGEQRVRKLPPLAPRYVPGAEKCESCAGAAIRNRRNKQTVCPSCGGSGQKLWRDNHCASILGVRPKNYGIWKERLRIIEFKLFDANRSALGRISTRV